MADANDPGELFVGRRLELAVLHRAMDAAVSGTGSVITITGEPGIGKSALARQAMSIAATRCFSVCAGKVREQGDAPPFWPWSQVIRGLCRASDEDDHPENSERLERLLGALQGSGHVDNRSNADDRSRFSALLRILRLWAFLSIRQKKILKRLFGRMP